MSSEGRLAGKIAVVTGAGGGQGKAVVERFSEEGATVLGVDLRFPKDAAWPDAGADALKLLELDITDQTATAQVAAWIEERGGCDILYNNAGLYLPGRGDGDVMDVQTEVWHRVIDVNLTGALLMIRATVPGMLRRGGGVVINVSSIAGVVGGGNVAYTASKAGLIGLTKSLAFTHGEHGIRCVALSPGPVDTPMMSHWENRWDELVKTVPLRRAATAAEIAKWAVFLASDEASFASGANIVVDGGRITGI